MTADVCLHQLQTEPIGCIILVVQAASPGSFPFLTLVAVPSMATLGVESPGDPPGILLADIWQASVLQPFTAVLDMEHPHCPIIAASEGFSCATTSSTPEFYLTDAKPLFFPAGKLFSKSVEIEPGESTYLAIFLPKICSPPLGLRWPTDIGLDEFVKSLELVGRAYKPFLLTIDALQPLLATWFSSI
jgi:hypothetical protein